MEYARLNRIKLETEKMSEQYMPKAWSEMTHIEREQFNRIAELEAQLSGVETEKMSEPLEIPPLLRQEVIQERKQKDARIAELEAQLAAAQAEIERVAPLIAAVSLWTKHPISWVAIGGKVTHTYSHVQKMYKEYEATKP
jgi:chromosome segregation ATPase